ncbi:MAG: hypothetical protein DCC49_13650, partial [Acidobacteria bacterium]
MRRRGGALESHEMPPEHQHLARFRRQRLGRRVGARIHWLVVAISVTCGFLLGSSCFPIGAPTLEAIALPPALPPPQRTVIQAADYSTLAVLYSENRTVVPLDRIPFQTRYAVLAVEDRRFYEHGGVDGRSVGRAAQANLGSGERLQGGSTITEQYVKNLYFMTEQRTFEQKAKEATLALRMEQLKSKEQILEGYLNSIYFGEGAYEQSEMVIQALLREAGATGIGRDTVKVNARAHEAAPDWTNLASPENYVGFERTEKFASPGGIWR